MGTAVVWMKIRMALPPEYEHRQEGKGHCCSYGRKLTTLPDAGSVVMGCCMPQCDTAVKA